MIKLIQLLKELKQVGNIYHFTTTYAIRQMIDEYGNIVLDNKYASPEGEGYFSFTRYANLQPIGINTARLKVDGTRMSNRYKFEPYMWGTVAKIPGTLVKTRDGEYESDEYEGDEYEAEERVPASRYGGKIDITPYILEVTIPSLASVYGVYVRETDPLWVRNRAKDTETVADWFERKKIPVRYVDVYLG